MINITITEKLWDGVRPGSVKKTGLSEAIRNFVKANPKSAPDTPKAFDTMIAAVNALGAAIAKSEDAVKKAKDDKKGAAARLKAWKQECDKAAEQLAAERIQLGLLKASVEADAALKRLAKTVEDAIVAANQLVKDITDGRLADNKTISQSLQDLRSAMRDGLKATQKDGFAQYIATFDQVLAWGAKPADVPLPPTAKAIKERLPVLEAAAEQARIAAEKLMVESSQNRQGEAADLAKDLVSDYRKMAANIKGFLAPAKKFAADAKQLGDKFKDLIAKKVPHDKLLPLVQTLHDKVMAFEETTLTELARGRVARGDVQAKRIKIRDSLDKTSKTYREFEAIASEEWNLVMVIFREVSEQVAQVHRQVERVLRLVGESSPEAKEPAEQMAKVCNQEADALKSRFSK
jgi:hypothetical protein